MSELKIKSGTKLQLALDAPVGKEPDFNMVCTFNKALDESAFLISAPMQGGKRLVLDENQKLLIRYNQGSESMILAGYADDVVKDGIRSYWKIRRVSEQRQFFQRADERLKVALKVDYYQDTWPQNEEGTIDPESGMSLDISAGGAAIYLNRRFEVGEIITMTLPRIGTAPEGKAIPGIVAAVCWQREAPKGSLYHDICGLQFRLGDGPERKRVQAYVSNVKKKYKL
jgi:hypothetical protein